MDESRRGKRVVDAVDRSQRGERVVDAVEIWRRRRGRSLHVQKRNNIDDIEVGCIVDIDVDYLRQQG
jgi:hypothetical protein